MFKTIALGFVAGFLAVLVFHQGAALLLHNFGEDIPLALTIFGRQVQPPYDMLPVPPLGVPAVIATSFWGGIWGILLAVLLREFQMPDLICGPAFGALALTMVGFNLIAGLQGLPPLPTGDRQAWWSAGLFNSAWGWGTALLLRRFSQRG